MSASDTATLVAVDGLSLEIRPGEIFGLLGPNGAGKSTTVHLAVGLLTPDEGRVDDRGRRQPRGCRGPAADRRCARRRSRCTTS